MFSRQVVYSIAYNELEGLIKKKLGAPEAWRIFYELNNVSNDSTCVEYVDRSDKEDPELAEYQQEQLAKFAAGDMNVCPLSTMLAELQRRGILAEDAENVLISISW